MTQTHSVSFRPTSFPQLLSEMSGLAPQGTRSWGNGVRTEGAEQPEWDWEGGLREWMRLWEQSREGVPALNTSSTLVASLSREPFPLTPKVIRWPGFWPSALCLTHFVPCCSSSTTSVLWLSYLTCSFSFIQTGWCSLLNSFPVSWWELNFLAKLQPF